MGIIRPFIRRYTNTSLCKSLALFDNWQTSYLLLRSEKGEGKHEMVEYAYLFTDDPNDLRNNLPEDSIKALENEEYLTDAVRGMWRGDTGLQIVFFRGRKALKEFIKKYNITLKGE